MFWILRSAVRSAGRHSVLLPPEQRTPSRFSRKAGPLIFAALLPLMTAGFNEGMHGDIRLGTVAAYVIAFLALMAAAGIFRLGGVIRERRAAAIRIARIPVAPSAADEARATALMRAQAAGWQFRGDTATLPLPKPPQAHPRPAQTRPRVATRAQIKLDAEEDERLLRIAAIIVQPCPFCGADEGGLCYPIEGCKWYELDRARGIYAHPMRIAKAIGNKSAELEDVLAQFDGNMPEEIMVSLL